MESSTRYWASTDFALSILAQKATLPETLAQLQADLISVGGRPCFSLLSKAALGCQGSLDLTAALMASEMLRELAWEKLYTGDWKDVAMAWRDLYSLATLLQVAMMLRQQLQEPAQQPPDRCLERPRSPPASDRSAAHANHSELRPASGVNAAQLLRELDMGVLMGGPRFRLALDQAIKLVQHGSDGPADVSAANRGSEGPLPKRARSAAWNKCSEQEAASAVNGLSGPVPPEAAILHIVPPPGSFAGKGTAVAKEHVPSLERFFSQYMTSPLDGCPVLLTGCMEDWPARRRWRDASYLRGVAGRRTVPVEVGRHYLADGWSQRLMPLADFLDLHLRPSGPAQETGYLAQHPLFDQIPALAEDIREPEYCSLGTDDDPVINAWFGPAGTVTPLHTDPKHNLLAQAVGHKYIRLYEPCATAQLRLFTEGLTTNASQVDLDDADDFQSVSHVPFQECILNDGQMLYIPPRWMHYVKSLSASFSVSFWWE